MLTKLEMRLTFAEKLFGEYLQELLQSEGLFHETVHVNPKWDRWLV